MTKYDDLLRLADTFVRMADRKKGKSLRELGHPNYITIYRAVISSTDTIGSMDYVTLSRKFAIGHADHGVVVDEESHHVLSALVKSSDVYEAYNPGEYFYDGPTIRGKIIYHVSP